MEYRKRQIKIPHLFPFALLYCIFSMFFVFTVAAQESDNRGRKNVLMLFDEQEKLPGLTLLEQSIRSTLNSDPSLKPDIFNESLDRSRFPDGGHDKFLLNYFRQKYSKKKIDVIVSVMGPSLDFLLENAAEFSPGTPIIFCGIDPREIQSRKLGPNIKGVLVKRGFGGSLEIALKLQPDTRNVVFIGGASDFDKRLIAQAREELSNFENRVNIEYLTDFELNELLNRVSQLPPNTIILTSTVFNDNTGKALVPHDVVSLISERANVPVYGFVDQFLGRGIVGGTLYSVEEHGKRAGEMALRVLQGQNIAEMPTIEADAAQDMFDWRELHRWGLDESNLPQGSVVRYRVASVWEQYRLYILAALIIGVLQTLLISWLLIARSRHLRSESERKKLQSLVLAEHQKLDAVVASVPVIVWESRIDGDLNSRRIVFISKYVEKILGFTPEEIKAIPNFWRSVVLEEDLEKLSEATLNMFGNHGKLVQEFRCRTKSGSVIWIDAYMDVTLDDGGKVVGLRGVAVDVTDRKQSEEAIRYLGAKLINAQEEERSRVARELHDGLSQSLALLSIQLGALGRGSLTPDSVSEQVEHYRKMIRSLSSDVHRISHELHPAKLEQLGLESALEGICREIAAAQKMEIDFVAQNIPKKLPKDVSLCLYRVTQESLQNVQKHSGAHAAVVRISASNQFVDLIVSDNGRGFNPTAASEKESLGLISMRERIRSVKGTLFVESHPGAGTHIRVQVPAG